MSAAAAAAPPSPPARAHQVAHVTLLLPRGALGVLRRQRVQKDPGGAAHLLLARARRRPRAAMPAEAGRWRGVRAASSLLHELLLLLLQGACDDCPHAPQVAGNLLAVALHARDHVHVPGGRVGGGRRPCRRERRSARVLERGETSLSHLQRVCLRIRGASGVMALEAGAMRGPGQRSPLARDGRGVGMRVCYTGSHEMQAGRGARARC